MRTRVLNCCQLSSQCFVVGLQFTYLLSRRQDALVHSDNVLTAVGVEVAIEILHLVVPNIPVQKVEAPTTDINDAVFVKRVNIREDRLHLVNEVRQRGSRERIEAKMVRFHQDCGLELADGRHRTFEERWLVTLYIYFQQIAGSKRQHLVQYLD